MKIEVERYLGAVTRAVHSLEREGKPARKVVLSRTYDTSVDDLWDAVTNPERLPRWFLPVSGDLRKGGRYQLQGNAGGEILVCDAPAHLGLTWEFSGDVSWVDALLAGEGSGARLTLEHVAYISDFWKQFGPGAVGVGWDIGLVGLDHHLRSGGAEKFDEAAFSAAEDGKKFIRGCAEDWRRAAVESGDDETEAAAASMQTAAFYTGETPAGG